MSKHRRPQPHRLRRSGVVLGLTATVVVAGAGSASAYFKQTGSGKRNATTGTVAGVVFTTTGTVTSLLYPGLTADLSLTVTKKATQAFTIKSLTPGTVTSSDPTNCPASWITVASKSLNQAIPAGSGTVAVSVPSDVTMSASAPLSCQGVTFSIPITLTGVLS